MKLVTVIAAWIGIAGIAMPASAQDINLEGVVRTMSLYAMIADKCPQFMRVNVSVSERSAAAARDIARKIAGPNLADKLLRDELLRRFREAEITGFEQWCVYQSQRATNRSVFPR